jgi:hypothetical protein
MKRIVDAFSKLYSLPAGNSVSQHQNSLTVNETEPDATFNQLNIDAPGATFYSVDKEFYKDLYDAKSPVLGNVNCDGVALVKHEDKPYLLLVELKSNLDTDKISKAFQQEVRSFLKMTSSLSLCDGYDINDIAIRGVIACHPFKSETARTKCLDNLLMERDAGKKDARFKYRIVTERKITARFATCKWFIPTDALTDDLRNHEFMISLVFGANYADQSCTIPLVDVI